MRYTTCSTGLLGLFLTVSGCGASAKTVAEKRASTDNCPADKIKSEEIVGGTIKVDARGKTAILSGVRPDFGRASGYRPDTGQDLAATARRRRFRGAAIRAPTPEDRPSERLSDRASLRLC